MSEFTPAGIILDRFPDVLAKLEEFYRTSFGENLDQSIPSYQGHFNRIHSEVIARQNELAEGIVAAFNLQAATGVYLSNLVLLVGIERKEAVFSTVSLEVTANTAGATIPAGYTVSDPVVGEPFAIDTETVIPPSGTVAVSATAINSGPITAVADTLTKIDNPVFGWASVTNPGAASVGANEESDTELRARASFAARRTGTANVSAIYTVLANIDEVESVQVYENNTAIVDSNGMPPQHIWAVVRGGSDTDIAEALHNTKPASVGYFGTSSATIVEYYDPITNNPNPYQIIFDRVEDVPNYIEVVVQKGQGYTSDSAMRQAIVDYYAGDFTIDGRTVPGFGIGIPIIHSRLYSPVNSIPGHSVDSLRVGLSPGTLGTSDLIMQPYQQGVILDPENDIVILEG